MKTGHKEVQRGKKVIIKFSDGSKKIDKFLNATPKMIEFEKLGKIPRGEINNLTILKGLYIPRT